jgi:phospholipase D1/2
VFDLDTHLHSPEARAIGARWFDLVVHTLARGVRLRVALTDFDPVVRPVVHARTWRTLRMFHGAAEIAGPGADLRIVPAMHPARVGLLPRLAIWPMVMKTLRDTCTRLNALPPAERATVLRDSPRLVPWLVTREDGRLRPRYASVPVMVPATHHQKLAIFDRQRLYIGGLDLNDRRYDTPAHDKPGPETWQDVQLMVEGPVVAEAQRHLETFLSVVAGTAPPAPQRRLLRTLSRKRRVEWPFFGPAPVTSEIAAGHDLLIARADRLIYLESQFFRDRHLARALAEAARRNPALGLIVMLPSAPEEVAFDASDHLDARFGEYLQGRCLRILTRAFHERVFIAAAAQRRRAGRPRGLDNGRDRIRGAELIYVHSKVSIFDTDRAIVSSANLNGRSLRWDTEAGVFLNDPAVVRRLRERLFAHWLPEGAGAAFSDPATAVRAWRHLGIRNARRAPEAREGLFVPYDLKLSESYGTVLPGVPEEMV